MDVPDVHSFFFFLPSEFVEVDGVVRFLIFHPRREVFIETLLCSVFMSIDVFDFLLENVECGGLYDTFVVDITLGWVAFFIL